MIIAWVSLKRQNHSLVGIGKDAEFVKVKQKEGVCDSETVLGVTPPLCRRPRVISSMQ